MKTWYAVTGEVQQHLPAKTIWHLHGKILAVDFHNNSERQGFENEAGANVVRLPSIYSGQRLTAQHLSALSSSDLTSNHTTYDAIVTVTANEDSPCLLR